MISLNTIITISITVAVLGIIFLLYWYAFRYETVNFTLSRLNIFLTGKNKVILPEVIPENLHLNPEDQKELFSVLHLSDFHLRKDRAGRALFKFIQNLKKNLTPDLIFITGDLVEKDAYFPYLQAMLSGFKAKYGIYAVFGVHDYYSKGFMEFIRNMREKKRKYNTENDIAELTFKLTQIGIKVLQNESVNIVLDNPDKNTGGAPDIIQIAGVEDSILCRSDAFLAFGKEKSQEKNQGKNWETGSNGSWQTGYNREKYCDFFELKKKKIHALNDNKKIIFCITHTPDMDLLVDLGQLGTDIIISGHTHGGQVRLPVIGAILSGCNIRTRYASGLFYFKQFVLYVNRGLGEGRYSQFRFFCQPEASLLTFYFKT